MQSKIQENVDLISKRSEEQMELQVHFVNLGSRACNSGMN